MLAQFLIPTHTYYARNYAGIIAASLATTQQRRLLKPASSSLSGTEYQNY